MASFATGTGTKEEKEQAGQTRAPPKSLEEQQKEESQVPHLHLTAPHVSLALLSPCRQTRTSS